MMWDVCRLIGACLLLSGCVAAESVVEAEYLGSEYGNVKEDAVVSGLYDDRYRVWVHKTKPKMIVGLEAGQAFIAGGVYGASHGLAKPEVEPGTYERAGATYFQQIGRKDCRVTASRLILNTGAELDFTCSNLSRPVPKA
ncbi:MAG: hypothetical protein JSR61_02630 [Proteobacteria bacterium]|nr:hypothetical protein [Pseudomonadota bacterium]